MNDGEPWNMRQWAEAHDKADDARFGGIWRIFLVMAVAFIGLTSWSLKSQYDSLQAQLAEFHQTQSIVQQTGDRIVAKVQQNNPNPVQETKP